VFCRNSVSPPKIRAMCSVWPRCIVKPWNISLTGENADLERRQWTSSAFQPSLVVVSSETMQFLFDDVSVLCELQYMQVFICCDFSAYGRRRSDELGSLLQEMRAFAKAGNVYARLHHRPPLENTSRHPIVNVAVTSTVINRHFLGLQGSARTGSDCSRRLLAETGTKTAKFRIAPPYRASFDPLIAGYRSRAPNSVGAEAWTPSYWPDGGTSYRAIIRRILLEWRLHTGGCRKEVSK
jgi:hypothetical protein